jgi:hypothetical protein
MRIYVDVFTNDEVLSDALEIVEEYEGSIMSVTSKLVNADDGGNIDVGNCNAFGGGDEEHGGNEVEKVNNIVSSFSLEEYFGSKKDIMSLFKERIGQMRERLKDNPTRLKAWEAGGQVEVFVKSVFAKFDDCKFYMGTSYSDEDPKEGMPIIAFWKKDDDTGETFYYFKDCYKVTKV